MSGSKKKNKQKKHVRHSLHKTRNWEVLRCRAKQRQRNVQKKMCCTCKDVFLLIRPIVVLSSFSLPSPLSMTRFYNYFA